MKILVSGATGFVGREIVSELTGSNHQVIGLTRSENARREPKLNVRFVRADITAFDTLPNAEQTGEIDVIIHAAGLAHQFGETRKEEFDLVNVSGTENLLKLAVKLRIKHFILIGSTAIYGSTDSLPTAPDSRLGPAAIDEETLPTPQTLYAASKLEAEKICRRICEENKISLTIFRLAPVIGEANVGNVARLIEAIDKNRFVWIGDGQNLKSLIYKKDVARACIKLIGNKKDQTEIFNLAAEPLKMEDFVSQIASRLGRRIFPIKISAILPRFFFHINAKFFKLRKIHKISETIEKWLSDDVYAADKIAVAYDFNPQTPILEAIDRQVDYYKQTR